MSTSDDFCSDLENRSPWVKLVAYGGPGDGKTQFLARVAIGLWIRLGTSKPLGFLDTEDAAKHLLPLFKAAGVPVKHRPMSGFMDLPEMMRRTREGQYAMLLADSFTHASERFAVEWQAREKIVSRSLTPMERGDLNAEWGRLVAEPFRDDPAHYLIAGREALEYETEVDADTQRRQSFASGYRMRGATGAAYEGALTVRLERREHLEAGKLRTYRVAIIEKDRTGAIDGHVLNEGRAEPGPTWEGVAPAVERILGDAAPAVALMKLAPLAPRAGAYDFVRVRAESKRKGLLVDEIKNLLDARFVGRKAEVLEERSRLAASVFGALSPDYPATLDIEILEGKYEALLKALEKDWPEVPKGLLDVTRQARVKPLAAGESLVDALGDLPDFPSSNTNDGAGRPDPLGPHKLPAPSVSTPSVHQVSEAHATEKAGKPVEKTPAVVLAQAEPAKSTAGAEERAGAAPAPCGPHGRPCFFCDGPTPMKDRYVLLPNPVSSDVPFETLTLTAPEGLHPCFLNKNGARSVLVAGEYLGIKPSECEDVCGTCGLRESEEAHSGVGEETEESAPVQNPKRPRKNKATGPLNSLGEPWQPDQVWTCLRCKETGPDRDDMRVPDCRGLNLPARAHHELSFSPDAHAVAIQERRSAGASKDAQPTPPFGSTKPARIPFSREIAVASLGFLPHGSMLDLLESPDEDTLGNGSVIYLQAEKVHGQEVANRLWEEAGGKWSKPGVRAAKRLSMKAVQWRRFVMSLPVAPKAAPVTEGAASGSLGVAAKAW